MRTRYFVSWALGLALLIPSIPAAAGESGSCCPPAPDPRPAPTPVAFSVLEEGSYSGVTERGQWVLDVSGPWEEYWKKHTRPQIPPPPVPAVDFAREMVLVVTMGQRNTGGYAVKVRTMEETLEWLEVAVDYISPGPGHGVTQALTQPYAIVTFPRTAKSFRYHSREVVSE